MSDVGFEVAAGVAVDEASFADFERVAAAAFERGARSGRAAGEAMGEGIDETRRKMTKLQADIDAILRKMRAQHSNKGITLVHPDETRMISQVQKRLQELLHTIAGADAADPALFKVLNKQLEALKTNSYSSTIEFQSQVKKAVAASTAAERDKTSEAERASRERMAVYNRETKMEASAARYAGEQALVASKHSAAQRAAATRAMFETIGRLERATGATVAGIARTATGAVSKIYDSTLGRIASSFRRNNSQINAITSGGGTERISIVQRILHREEAAYSRSLSRQERLYSESITRTKAKMETIQRQASTGVAGAVTGRGMGMGLGALAGGFGVGALLSSGLSRYGELEALNKQFLALTQNAGDASALMEQVKAYAKLTPFDLTGVASLAKGFLAIKTPLDQIMPRITAVTDAVALTGGGVENLNNIQRAIGQVVSAGRLQGDELNQIAENLPGLNIRQILADQLTGGDVAALTKLQEAGKLSAQSVVDGLMAGLSSDTRLSGASKDLADTLTGQLANAKENLSDVGASIVGLFAKPMQKAIALSNTAMAGFTSFVRGEVSPAMKVLREAAFGAAAGIGTLVVAKGAAEAMKLLWSAASLLTSPMGLLVGLFAALGAGIALLIRHSPAFVDGMKRAWASIGAALVPIKKLIGEGLGWLETTINDKVVPAIERFGVAAGEWVSGAANTAVDWVLNSFIPAVREGAKWVNDHIVPALVDFGQRAAKLASKGIELLKAGFRNLQPYLQAAWGYLQSLGRVAGTVLGEIRDGLSSIGNGGDWLRKAIVGAGIGGAAGAVAGPMGAVVGAVAGGLASLSPTIVGAFKTAMTKAGTEVKSGIGKVRAWFNDIDWGGLASKAAGFIEKVGFIIGNIATDPIFLAALTGIAAAAALIAVKFAEGLAKGILDNIGTVTVALIAVFAGVKTFGLMKTLAAKLAATFTASFAKSVPKTAGGGTSNLQAFWSGLVGTPGSVSSYVTKVNAKARETMQTEIRRTNMVLRQAGKPMISGLFKLEDGAKQAKTAMASLGKEMGGAAVDGLKMRVAMSGNPFKNFGDKWALQGEALGMTTGQRIGTAVMAALGSALAGNQLGKGDVVGGLGGIIASSLGAFAMTGNPLIGGAVAGLGLVTAAFTASGEAAKKAKAQVDDYANAIVNAGSAGKETLLGTIQQQLEKEQQGTIDAINKAKISGEDLLSIFKDADMSGLKDMSSELTDIAKKSDYMYGSFDDRVAALNSALDGMAGGPGKIALRSLIDQVASGAIGVGDFTEALDFLKDESGEMGKGIDKANSILSIFQAKADLAGASAAALTRSHDKGLKDDLDAAKQSAVNLRDRLDGAITAVRALLNPEAGSLAETLNSAILGLSGVGSQLAGGLDLGGILGQADVDQALSGLKGSVADVVSKGMSDGLTEGEIDAKLGGLQLAVSELDIPQSAKDMMTAVIQDAINRDLPEVQVTADPGSADRAGAEIADAIDRQLANSNAEGLGRNVSESMARGIRAKKQEAVLAALELAGAVAKGAQVTLRIHSPSKVFVGIGEQIGAGMAVGITNSTATVVDSVKSMTATVIDQAQLAADKAAAAMEARLNVIDSMAGNTGTFSAGNSLLAALQGVADASTGDNTNDNLFGIEGLANSNAVAQAVEAAKALARASLQGGASSASVAEQLADSRKRIIDFGAWVGLDINQLSTLVDNLGLTSDAIANFAANVDAAAQAAADQAEADAQAAAAQDAASATEAGTTVINHWTLTTPYSDPEAVALAVSNRQARGARL